MAGQLSVLRRLHRADRRGGYLQGQRPPEPVRRSHSLHQPPAGGRAGRGRGQVPHRRRADRERGHGPGLLQRPGPRRQGDRHAVLRRVHLPDGGRQGVQRLPQRL